MTRKNSIETVKLPVSFDAKTDVILARLATVGLFGKNKAEVVYNIIQRWLWDNYERLERHGVRLSKADANARGSAKR